MNTTAFFALFVGTLAILFGHAVTGLCLLAVAGSILAHQLRSDINIDRAVINRANKLLKGD